MLINKIELKNWRNHEAFSISFNNNLNIIVGNNGAGKTNILDAIYYQSLFTSHKQITNEKLIKDKNDFASIMTVIENETIKTVITDKTKRIFIDEIEVNKISDAIGIVNSILFTPDDLFLFKSTPSTKRRFIDQEISKSDPMYLLNLQVSNKLVQDRNKTLKSKNTDKKLIDVIDDKLAQTSAYVIQKRLELVHDINNSIQKYFEKITNKAHKIALEYISALNPKTMEFGLLSKQIRYSLAKNYERDLATQQTNIGFHRDSLSAKIDGEDASKIASQGENRALILALKLVLVEIFVEKHNIKPILLLDDVLSELDSKTQCLLINLLQNHNSQIIITTTDLNKVDEDLVSKSSIIEL